MNIICIAQQVGNAYRGEVLDAKTYRTVLITAHCYANEVIAKIAARRTWEGRELAQNSQEMEA